LREALAELKAGAKRLQAGRYADAERHFRLALRFAPHHPDALNLLGVALLRGERVRIMRRRVPGESGAGDSRSSSCASSMRPPS